MTNNSIEQGKEGAANINCLSIIHRRSAEMLIPGPLTFSSTISDPHVCLEFFRYCNHQNIFFKGSGLDKLQWLPTVIGNCGIESHT